MATEPLGNLRPQDSLSSREEETSQRSDKKGVRTQLGGGDGDARQRKGQRLLWLGGRKIPLKSQHKGTPGSRDSRDKGSGCSPSWHEPGQPQSQRSWGEMGVAEDGRAWWPGALKATIRGLDCTPDTKRSSSRGDRPTARSGLCSKAHRHAAPHRHNSERKRPGSSG